MAFETFFLVGGGTILNGPSTFCFTTVVRNDSFEDFSERPFSRKRPFTFERLGPLSKFTLDVRK